MSYTLLFSFKFWSYFSNFLWLFSKFKHKRRNDRINLSIPQSYYPPSVLSFPAFIYKDNLPSKSQCEEYLYVLFRDSERYLPLFFKLLFTFNCYSAKKTASGNSFFSRKLSQEEKFGTLGLLFYTFLTSLESLASKLIATPLIF